MHVMNDNLQTRHIFNLRPHIALQWNLSFSIFRSVPTRVSFFSPCKLPSKDKVESSRFDLCQKWLSLRLFVKVLLKRVQKLFLLLSLKLTPSRNVSISRTFAVSWWLSYLSTNSIFFPSDTAVCKSKQNVELLSTRGRRPQSRFIFKAYQKYKKRERNVK